MPDPLRHSGMFSILICFFWLTTLAKIATYTVTPSLIPVQYPSVAGRRVLPQRIQTISPDQAFLPGAFHPEPAAFCDHRPANAEYVVSLPISTYTAVPVSLRSPPIL